jgi:hypothetical protein
MPYVGQDFTPADLGEVRPLSFNLNGALADSETISSVVFSISVQSGTDATPSTHITGTNTVTGTTVSNTFTWSGSAVAGNRYCIKALSTTNLNNIYSFYSYIAIQTTP